MDELYSTNIHNYIHYTVKLIETDCKMIVVRNFYTAAFILISDFQGMYLKGVIFDALLYESLALLIIPKAL